MSDSVARSGFIALVGRTNAGKSTLLNRVLGRKLAIVTEQRRTTYLPAWDTRTTYLPALNKLMEGMIIARRRDYHVHL